MARKAIRESRRNGDVDSRKTQHDERPEPVGKEGAGVTASILGFYAAIKLCLRGGYEPSEIFNLVLTEIFPMSIDAKVETVIHNEDGSGELRLVDRPATKDGVPGIAGQRTLCYTTAPHEVTALNGLNIWGGSSSIMLGEIEIAKREGYTRIVFHADDVFKDAVKKYHQKHNSTPVKHPSELRDFEFEVTQNEHGVTIQIVYAGRPSDGMSMFGGTFKSARLGMAAFLRQLADEAYRLPSDE